MDSVEVDDVVELATEDHREPDFFCKYKSKLLPVPVIDTVWPVTDTLVPDELGAYDDRPLRESDPL